MTKTHKKKSVKGNEASFTALKLIVQNILRKRLKDRMVDLSLSQRIGEDLKLTATDLMYLGKYLSEVYHTDMIIAGVDSNVTLNELIERYYQKMETKRDEKRYFD